MGTSTWVSGGRSLISADAPVITSTDGVKITTEGCMLPSRWPAAYKLCNHAKQRRALLFLFRANSLNSFELFPVSLSYGIRVILRCTTTGHESHFLRILARITKVTKDPFVHSFFTLSFHSLAHISRSLNMVGLINCSNLAVTHSRPARSSWCSS